jgi:hypothetical protein
MTLSAVRIHKIAKTEGQLFKSKCLHKNTIVCNELINRMKITEPRNLLQFYTKCSVNGKTKRTNEYKQYRIRMKD